MHSGLGILLTTSKETAFLTHVCSSNEVFGVYEIRQEDRFQLGPQLSTISPRANTKLKVQ